jgi:hypothetical protein
MTAHSPAASTTSAKFENSGTAADYFTSHAMFTSLSSSSPKTAFLSEKTQPEKTQLGWVLTQNKLITPPQLETALTSQQSDSKKLGELLMEQRLISEDQLRDALREQIIRRRGHWVI